MHSFPMRALPAQPAALERASPSVHRAAGFYIALFGSGFLWGLIVMAVKAVIG